MTGGVSVNKEQLEILEKIRKIEHDQSDRWMEYWYEYSNIYSWQLWVVIAMLVVPLIMLFLFIDRRKVFHLGFYGYSIHIFMAITDAFGVSRGAWIYPYKLVPGVPANVSLDASFVPVSYILLYQYTLNKGKNYYIWMLALSLVFAFVVKPLMVGIGLFRFGGKEDFLMLFWLYLGVALISKWITDAFIFLGKTKKWSLYKQ